MPLRRLFPRPARPVDRRLRRSVTAGAVAAALMLAGCGGDPDLVEEPDASGSESAAPGSEEPGSAVPSDLASLVEKYNESAPPVEEDEDAEAPPETVELGADVGWPQCPEGVGIPEKQGQGQPMPDSDSEFVIIGLTNSPSFTTNPCLDDQIEWAKDRDLWVGAYSVVSFPSEKEIAQYGAKGPWDGTTERGALRNVGFNAARYNVKTMKQHGLDVPLVWIDVEPVSKFEWSDDTSANAAVIVGMAKGYREAGYRIGAYSLESMWSDIAGDLRLYAPEWRPAGGAGREEAESRCGDDWSFQGGNGVLAQWVEDHRDHNVSCPGVDLKPERWFFRY